MNRARPAAVRSPVRAVPIVVVIALAAIGVSSPARAQVDAAPWQRVLSGYVTRDGGVRYAALRANEADRAALERYVRAIAEAEPDGWSRNAQLAFYLNAYNALVVHAVLEHWPIESVQGVPGFFDRERHRVAGRAMTLNQLENEVIRRRFDEPRIHFALNCASASCPPLSRRAFEASSLDRRLAALTRAFVRRTTRVTGDAVRVSRIFEWYGEDFEDVRAFVASRLAERDRAGARDEGRPLRFDPYDWDLNDR